MRNRPNSALLLLVAFFAMLWSLEASANTLESVHKWSLQSRGVKRKLSLSLTY